MALELHGFEVHVAHDGPEALRLGETRPFKALVKPVDLRALEAIVKNLGSVEHRA